MFMLVVIGSSVLALLAHDIVVGFLLFFCCVASAVTLLHDFSHRERRP